MSTLLKSPLPRNCDGACQHAAGLRSSPLMQPRRRSPVWSPADDDEGRFLARCVMGILLMAVTPLLVFCVVHRFFPGLLLLDITPG